MSTEAPIPDRCANRECGRYLVELPARDPGRSTVDDRFCVDCGDLFASFQPRSCDYPFRIAPELLCEGQQIQAEQCDNCGGSEYTFRSRRFYQTTVWEAVCDSCGTPWPIVARPGRLIVW